MAGEPSRDEGVASGTGGIGASDPDVPRLSRRQAIGRMSALAAVGAAAWVTPEILTARPADGAVLSGTTEPATLSPDALPKTASAGEPSSGGGLAFTGLDLERDTELGVALLVGGWAMHHWASRPLRVAARRAAAAGTNPGARAAAPSE